MSPPDNPHALVGQQLAERREELDLTQEAVARRIGITATTVSVTERGRTQISRSKRPKWEQSLRLKPGTITRAYRDDSPLEPLDSEEVFADLKDPYERAIWDMNLSEEDRKIIIELLRQDRRERQQSA